MKITFISCWAIDFVECDPILNLVLITCKDDATKPEIIVNHLAESQPLYLKVRWSGDS